MARRIHRSLCSDLAISAAAFGLVVASRAGTAQTWTRVTQLAPAPVNLMLLLSDGTVMAAAQSVSSSIGNGWYRLTPDSHGSYINGTWTTLAAMHDSRLYYSSQVLRDGRVWVAGGEYGTGGAKAEVYNPLTNTWTAAPISTTLLNPSQNSPATNSPQEFADACSEILPDGRVLVTPVHPRTNGQSLLYNPATNTWSAGPNLFRGIYQAEATWVKLPDDSILTIDPYGTSSERYIPSLNTWINDSTVPTTLYDAFVSELGGAMLLGNGKALFLGSTGRTALYTPSGGTSPGVWVQGPTFPAARGAPDAPAAMLVTGNVLCAVGQAPVNSNPFVPPTTFYEYNTASNSFTSVPAPVGSSDNTAVYATMMLNLPDGSVLYSHFGREVYTYRPAGAALASAKPAILSCARNADGSFHLSGTGFNGQNQGATYGDDAQMSSNYPLVRLLDGAGGVYYGRTFNWSSTGVMTGDQVVSTEYRLPATLPPGSYVAVVVANGVASDPLCSTPPSIVTHPVPSVTCTDSAGAFTVDAVGPPSATVSYQWQFIGGPAPLTAATWTDVADGPNNVSGQMALNAAGSRTATLSVDRAGEATGWTTWGTLPQVPLQFRCVVSNECGVAMSNAAKLMVTPADLGNQGGGSGADGVYDNNDFIVFIAFFFASSPRADVGSRGGEIGSDGLFDNNDFIVYIDLFFSHCQ